MAHYEDLVEVRERYGPWERLLAVGWLRKGTRFATGEVPAKLLPRLRALRKSGLVPQRATLSAHEPLPPLRPLR